VICIPFKSNHPSDTEVRQTQTWCGPIMTWVRNSPDVKTVFRGSSNSSMIMRSWARFALHLITQFYFSHVYTHRFRCPRAVDRGWLLMRKSCMHVISCGCATMSSLSMSLLLYISPGPRLWRTTQRWSYSQCTQQSYIRVHERGWGRSP
jgi:hypothetical protein